MNKPTRLYHASANPNINIFEPRELRTRGLNEGPVIFATPDIAYASCFMLDRDGSWVGVHKWGKSNWVVDCIDRERFFQNDKGGAIYILASDSFTNDPQKGTGFYEWISKEAVAPIDKIIYTSALEAMLENNVQIFFITPEQRQAMEKSDDYGYRIIQQLQSEGKSYNQEVGRNYHEV